MNDVITAVNLALALVGLMVAVAVPVVGAAFWLGRTAHSMDTKLDRIIKLLQR